MEILPQIALDEVDKAMASTQTNKNPGLEQIAIDAVKLGVMDILKTTALNQSPLQSWPYKWTIPEKWNNTSP